MYRNEVPLYGDLLSIISTVNSEAIRRDPALISDDEISRLNVERHGAIRVGTADELNLLARIFKVFGMHPVGYYDLAKDAGLPIHATAFRPVEKEELVKNPFRIFTSLLRMDLIEDRKTRELARELLGKRKIVSDRCMGLLVKAESNEAMERVEALEFVEKVVEIFAWHSDTPVSMEEYRLLAKTHPLVADIVSFRGPHINHLTPRTLDIDQVQRKMFLQGMDAKEVVEGPPPRVCPIYLRQTSFHALSERVVFNGANGMAEGKHKARFGEIEARGQALTRKGAKLYDELMVKVATIKEQREREESTVSKEDCQEILKEVFGNGFPDEKEAIMRQGLGYWTFSIRDVDLARRVWEDNVSERSGYGLLVELVTEGAIDAEPITYEDFLPASAAGIFQSNLPQQALDRLEIRARDEGEEEVVTSMDEEEARRILQDAVGGQILDYFELYAEQQRKSLAEVGAAIGVDMNGLAQKVHDESA